MQRNEKILFADNKPAFLNTRKQFIEQEGYQVITAGDPEAARKILEKGDVALAILDVRLRDDDDDQDRSGLELAMNCAPSIPKIILTAFPTWELVRQALGADVDGLPPAVDFICKEEGPGPMLLAVELALHNPYLKTNLLSTFNLRNMMELPDQLQLLGPDAAAERLQRSFDMTVQQLSQYQDAELRHATNHHRWALIWSITGILVILSGVILVYFSKLPSLTLSAVASIILEAVSVLFFVREDIAHKRVAAYYSRLEEVSKLANIISICDTIVSGDKREKYKAKVIDKMIENWFRPC